MIEMINIKNKAINCELKKKKKINSLISVKLLQSEKQEYVIGLDHASAEIFLTPATFKKIAKKLEEWEVL